MKKLAIITMLAASTTATAGHNFINPNAKYGNVECNVVGVLDGDTLDCLTDSKEKIRVRLSSIDAPEKKQAFGQKSKQKLSDLAFGKRAIISIENKDRYGRNVAEVFVSDDPYSVNYRMVESGLAWAYERYVKDLAYITAQQYAKASRRGLWADSNPVSPEDFRRHK